ncbi:prepilin-type N-terminal cleavage/methylation domain-containing protein [Pseudomonas duriflava]|uniref:Prepilin-type N-terminal cleavage/methylation domain-containing protein n=1 Tax=Pseudomonas duriflava TaxID=459528 RepID=A0A562Q7N6_9PSED|nr:prepilin-type N-terminal cleavage/methylation domain-containing protein [Pseudomonas duriflava]TWI52771.1 prepilin-type N-terminal cleavage/methylation domain-containing protein [Pseudomonas duriflava]
MVRRAKGFTLIELMVTIAVLSILMMAGIPLTQGWVNSAHQRDAASVMQQGIARAKAVALRNPAGVAGTDKAAVLLCRSDATLVLVRPENSQKALDCAQSADAQVLWSGTLPKQVDIVANNKRFLCLALDNQALPVKSDQAHTECSTANPVVKIGREDDLPINVI